MSDRHEPEHVLPLVEERASVATRTVETGRVRVRTVVDEREELVRATLGHMRVSIERVPVGREIASVPEVREEGDVTIVPIVEEVLVVEKRLLLREELHVRRVRDEESIEHPVRLRSTRAVVERLDPQGSSGNETVPAVEERES